MIARREFLQMMAAAMAMPALPRLGTTSYFDIHMLIEPEKLINPPLVETGNGTFAPLDFEEQARSVFAELLRLHNARLIGALGFSMTPRPGKNAIQLTLSGLVRMEAARHV